MVSSFALSLPLDDMHSFHTRYTQKQREKHKRFSKVSIATLENILTFTHVYDTIIVSVYAETLYREKEQHDIKKVS